MTDFVEPNKNDVLLSRGFYGRNQVGTQAYRALVEESKYRDGQKKETAKVIVDTMIRQGRRFLRTGPFRRWYTTSYDDAISSTLLALEDVPNASGATANGSAAISESTSRAMTVTANYGDNDILLGQGKGQLHPGNDYYRNLIRLHHPGYIKSSRTEKPVMARRLVKKVNEDGYRFLERKRDGLWYVVGDKHAIHAVKKALGNKKQIVSEAKEELKSVKEEPILKTWTWDNGSNSSIYTSQGSSVSQSQYSSSYSQQNHYSSKTSFGNGYIEIDQNDLRNDLGSNNGVLFNVRKNEDDDVSMDLGNNNYKNNFDLPCDEDDQNLEQLVDGGRFNGGDLQDNDSGDENSNRVCEPKSLIAALSTTTVNYYSVYHSLVRSSWISLQFDYRKECEVTIKLESLFNWVFSALKSRQQVIIVVSAEDLMFFETNLKYAILEKYKIKNWEDAFEGTQIEIHTLGCSHTGELANSILHMLTKEGVFVFVGSDDKVRLFERYTQKFVDKCITFRLGDLDPDQRVRVHMDWYYLLGLRPYDENEKKNYFRLQYMLLCFCLHIVFTINEHVKLLNSME